MLPLFLLRLANLTRLIVRISCRGNTLYRLLMSLSEVELKQVIEFHPSFLSLCLSAHSHYMESHCDQVTSTVTHLNDSSEKIDMLKTSC